MLIITHIIIALTSLVAATLAIFRPSKAVLQTSYWLIAGTIVTGTYLAVSHPSHLATSCMSGLAYLAAVSASLWYGRQRRLQQANTLPSRLN